MNWSDAAGIAADEIASPAHSGPPEGGHYVRRATRHGATVRSVRLQPDLYGFRGSSRSVLPTYSVIDKRHAGSGPENRVACHVFAGT